MELIAPGLLCAMSAAAAAVAALARSPSRACLALGLTVVCVAALALLHFEAPLAGASLLIAHGGLGVVNGRLARQGKASPDGIGPGWALAVVVTLAGILVAALAPAAATDEGPVAPGDQAFLVAVVALVALAVTLGLSAVWRNDDGTAGS